ncbi:DUF4747 domain-containing protein [Clostridium sp. AWRP]|uniref:DUF4747 domain-containing protein n=1 Tax=Clostridium sp. AWRP TaxID=2212991 RepID=UPI000FDB2D94|nr:DUF4747 domain-containing protein [Clostridium sp. AWRP]AZV56036.1 DUF4747 domain-containing protein [Clostridium sp. AWRP]
MSRTVYFAKVNVNSKSTYKVYKKEVDISNIMLELASKIKNNIKYVREIEKIVDGETFITNQEFAISGVSRIEVDSELMIVGGVIKTAKVFINNVNKSTGKKTTTSVNSDEVINFCFYPNKEVVAYYCPLKFGNKEFIPVFENLINNAFKEEHFTVSTITNGLSLDNIKESLRKIKNIKELHISIIPPNPNGKTKKALQQDAESKIKSFEQGRITERSTIFKSSYEEGLDTDSEEISKHIDDATAIHSKINVKEATKNGYVNIIATNEKGTIFNTNNKKVVKHRMDDEIVGDNNFASFCKNVIEKIL